MGRQVGTPIRDAKLGRQVGTRSWDALPHTHIQSHTITKNHKHSQTFTTFIHKHTQYSQQITIHHTKLGRHHTNPQNFTILTKNHGWVTKNHTYIYIYIYIYILIPIEKNSHDDRSIRSSPP